MIITPLMLTIIIVSSIMCTLFVVLKLGVLFCIPTLYRLNDTVTEHEHRYLYKYWICISLFSVFLWLGYFMESRPILAIAGLSIMFSTVFIVLMYTALGAKTLWDKIHFWVKMKRHDLKRANNLR